MILNILQLFKKKYLKIIHRLHVTIFSLCFHFEQLGKSPVYQSDSLMKLIRHCANITITYTVPIRYQPKRK